MTKQRRVFQTQSATLADAVPHSSGASRLTDSRQVAASTSTFTPANNFHYIDEILLCSTCLSVTSLPTYNAPEAKPLATAMSMNNRGSMVLTAPRP